jgi:hypothetical protein
VASRLLPLGTPLLLLAALALTCHDVEGLHHRVGRGWGGEAAVHPGHTPATGGRVGAESEIVIATHASIDQQTRTQTQDVVNYWPALSKYVVLHPTPPPAAPGTGSHYVPIAPVGVRCREQGSCAEGWVLWVQAAHSWTPCLANPVR